MPKLVYFVACEKVLLGEEDKSPSLITLFDQITVPMPSSESVDIQAGMHWSLVSYWLKLSEDDGKQYQQRTFILSPDGTKSGEAFLDFEMISRRHRNTIRVFGFPIKIAGDYLVKLSIREVGNQDWTDIADYPMIVTHSNDAPTFID